MEPLTSIQELFRQELFRRGIDVNPADVSSLPTEIRNIWNSVVSGDIYQAIDQQVNAAGALEIAGGNGDRSLILHSGTIDGENARAVADAVVAAQNGKYYLVGQTQLATAGQLAMEGALYDSAVFNALSPEQQALVEDAYLRVLDRNLSQRVTAAAAHIVTLVGNDATTDSTFFRDEASRISGSATVNEMALPGSSVGNAAAVADVAKGHTEAMIEFARPIAEATGFTITEVIAKLNLPESFDAARNTAFGQSASFWKTLGAPDFAAFAAKVMEHAAASRLPNETMREAGARVLTEAMRSLERYAEGGTGRWGDAARAATGADLGTVFGVGYVGVLGVNSIIDATRKGAWYGALEFAVGGGLLVAGGLAFAGVLSIAVAVPIAATAVEVIGLGLAFYGLIDQVEHLVARLRGEEVSDTIVTTIITAFSPSDDRAPPVPHSTLAGVQVFAIGITVTGARTPKLLHLFVMG